jgi:tripartite-type tricarboxylate transporter receptor subunit TctC
MLPNVMLVHPHVPAQNVREMIALLKAEPTRYSYASSGVGTPLHLSGELFKMMSGTEMKHIPYRGAGPALNDVVAGHVRLMFDTLPSATQHIQSGALRALAVTTRQRAASMPKLPTLEEAGMPGYETYAWQGLFAPRGMPTDSIANLNDAVNRATKDPGVSERLRELGATAVGSTPEQLEVHVKAELAKWAPVAKAAGALVD